MTTPTTTGSLGTALLGTASRDRGSVHLERPIAASIETVWAAWTDPARMSQWLAPVEGTPAECATFVLRMTGDEAATCTVHAWEPPRLIELSWHYTGEAPSRLRIRLSETDGPGGDGTRLVLDHDRLFDADPVDYGAGWHAELDLLVAYLGGEPKPAFMPRFERLRPLYASAAEDPR